MDIEIRDFKDRRGRSHGGRYDLETQPKEIPYEVKYQENRNVRNLLPGLGRETIEEARNGNVGIGFQGNVRSDKGYPYEEDAGHLLGPRNDPSDEIPIDDLKEDERCHHNDGKSCEPIHDLRKYLSQGNHFTLRCTSGLRIHGDDPHDAPTPPESGEVGAHGYLANSVSASLTAFISLSTQVFPI